MDYEGTRRAAVSTPEIQKVLVLSTAHLAQNTANDMTENAAEWSYDDLEYGYLLWVPQCFGCEYPAEIRRAFALAQEYDCAYVRYDCDAEKVPGLEVFEW